jgi:hypothetical protein
VHPAAQASLVVGRADQALVRLAVPGVHLVGVRIRFAVVQVFYRAVRVLYLVAADIHYLVVLAKADPQCDLVEMVLRLLRAETDLMADYAGQDILQLERLVGID